MIKRQPPQSEVPAGPLGNSTIREYPNHPLGYAEEIVKTPSRTLNMGALAMRGLANPVDYDTGAIYVQTIDHRTGRRYQYSFNADGLVGHQTNEAQEVNPRQMARSRFDITIGEKWRMPVGRIPFWGRRAKGVVEAVAVPYISARNPGGNAREGSHPPTVRGLYAIRNMLDRRGKSS
jgi:hypothetical protein